MAAGQVTPLSTDVGCTHNAAALVLRCSSSVRAVWLVTPYAVFLLLVYLVPLGYIVGRSVLDHPLTFRHYERLMSEPIYSQVFLNTAFIAALVTLLCLLLGYPFALVITRVGGRTSRLLFLIALVPFWTSILVRSYALLVMLQHQGVVNRLLVGLHLTSQPIPLVYNLVGVVLGMAYVLLPFMILSLYASLRSIDNKLSIVAATLGADRRTIFWRVLMPLSRPGIVAGSVLVFILGFGFFITPALLGGLGQTTVGMVIEAQMNRLLDWGFGSSLAVALTAVIVTLAWVAGRRIEFRLMLGAGLN